MAGEARTAGPSASGVRRRTPGGTHPSGSRGITAALAEDWVTNSQDLPLDSAPRNLRPART
ncbi:hypothetical protein AB0D14_37095 [Streptomyces sp. NPDC048484]|uniref:hypothetical protein n=1 Tax=Streptomyces sp. NPDC048484 TaxID=3155146 RepID=UPI0034362C03